MRFAIFGDHVDGWRMADVLRASGRHHVVAGTAAPSVAEADWSDLRIVGDPEELLADPGIEAVIVAGPPSRRLELLRRVLQSERPALCVHPVDSRPDGAYEIQMLQGDTHQVVLPILPEAYASNIAEMRSAFEPHCVLELEWHGIETPSFDERAAESRPAFPLWTLLRRIGGEIVEFAVFANHEALESGDPAVGFGKFQDGRLFQALWLARQPRRTATISIRGRSDGPVVTWSDGSPECWRQMVERFETAVARLRDAPRVTPGSGPAVDLRDGLGWQDEIRALELNDLARRSIERRRAYTLDFQEATEEVGFKGTMTLIGCALLWLAPVLLILSAWAPWLGWMIAPVLVAFLALQLLKGKG